MPTTIKRGDTRPVIDIPLTERADRDALLTVVDLSDVASALVILSGRGTDTVIERAGTVTTADPGDLGLEEGDFEDSELDDPINVVRLTFANGDTDVVDDYNLEVELTYTDGGIETIPNEGYETVVISQDLGGA